MKVAALDGQRTGFLYAIPIEFSPWGPLGSDLLVIPCLYSMRKGHGVGKALLTAAEQEAKHHGREGIVTTGYYHEHWFMPASLFEANVFVRCPSTRGAEVDVKQTGAVLWRVSDRRAQPPALLRPSYEFKPVPGKVVIDLFWNTFFQTSAIEAQRVKEVAAEFGDAVVLSEYSGDDPAVLLRYQMPRGIFVNGQELFWGHEAPKDGLREAIFQPLRE